MASGTDALSRCKECIDARESFLLQGGAGSGKTEALKELLLYIKNTKPGASVVCITHTNAAVNEIVNRVGADYSVSTIHSFLYSLIGYYRKNIKQALPSLFLLETVEANSSDHKEYKKRFEKYNRKYFDMYNASGANPVQKRVYDKTPTLYNQVLNQKIDELNEVILRGLEDREFTDKPYNETQFNSFRDGSFGHDGLLIIFHILFHRHPLLRKIIRDKYDYIFIDEYQDTNADILRDLLGLSEKGGLSLGLFGDHMQSIYDRGIDDLKPFIEQGDLVSVPKRDNYRCSYEVIGQINSLRTDGIEQEVAFKEKNDGSIEAEADRHGSARVWYAVIDNKPHVKSSIVDKQRYHDMVEYLIAKARAAMDDPAECKVLILTNKEIAEQNGFAQLYRIFDERYPDARDRIETYMRRIQALEVAELCGLYEKKQFNELICRVKKSGYQIYTARHKAGLQTTIETLLYDPDLSMQAALKLAAENRLIEQTEVSTNEASRKNQQETDPRYKEFLSHYQNGYTTYAKLKTVWDISSKEEFDFLEGKRKREAFYQELYSEELKFSEVRNYCAYLDERTEYITMHKTKGTSIPSVIVVMEEFFWNEYDFSLLWNPVPGKEKKLEKSQKLIYVACSRARKNLACIRILTSDEEALFKTRFPQAERIDISEFLAEAEAERREETLLD